MPLVSFYPSSQASDSHRRRCPLPLENTVHYRVGFTPEREPSAEPTANRLSALETIPLTVGLPDQGGVRPMLDQVEHWASELLDPATRDDPASYVQSFRRPAPLHGWYG